MDRQVGGPERQPGGITTVGTVPDLLKMRREWRQVSLVGGIAEQEGMRLGTRGGGRGW